MIIPTLTATWDELGETEEDKILHILDRVAYIDKDIQVIEVAHATPDALPELAFRVKEAFNDSWAFLAAGFRSCECEKCKRNGQESSYSAVIARSPELGRQLIDARASQMGFVDKQLGLSVAEAVHRQLGNHIPPEALADVTIKIIEGMKNPETSGGFALRVDGASGEVELVGLDSEEMPEPLKEAVKDLGLKKRTLH